MYSIVEVFSITEIFAFFFHSCTSQKISSLPKHQEERDHCDVMKEEKKGVAERQGKNLKVSV
jgi:uncharacterized membrane-anchored protein YitT (DUF2179 family)